MGQDLNQSESSEYGEIGSLYPMRLQKFLARAGVASRRGSENLMSAGRVKVNGQIVTELGSKVHPLNDTVEVDGATIEWGSVPTTIILNKPAGYVTTMNDPQGRPCVAELVPVQEFPGLYPVGRLDKATRGLLLFSTDGELGHNLLHPSHHVVKTYLAWVEGTPSAEQLSALRRGIQLEDGMTAPAEVSLERAEEAKALLRISIHEGRKRQVRRMCASIGHECLDLQRISFGPLQLGELMEGTWRKLTQEETSAVYLAARKQC